MDRKWCTWHEQFFLHGRTSIVYCNELQVAASKETRTKPEHIFFVFEILPCALSQLWRSFFLSSCRARSRLWRSSTRFCLWLAIPTYWRIGESKSQVSSKTKQQNNPTKNKPEHHKKTPGKLGETLRFQPQAAQYSPRCDNKIPANKCSKWLQVARSYSR